DRYAYVAIKTAGLTGAASTALTLSWPLAAAVSAAPDDQTRELLLREATRQPVYRARVFPLGLPQDRVDSTRGWLEVREGRLCLHQVGAGRGLYVPLVLDWTPERRRSPADWRTLTV